jgi:hypothetical protein
LAKRNRSSSILDVQIVISLLYNIHCAYFWYWKMRSLFVFLLSIASFRAGARAELSSSACSVLRTATSIATMTPEFAQLAMRYYSSSSTASVSIEPPHRVKRFLFKENSSKDGVKGSVLEQMVANAFKDVNFTRVALLMLQNNETMNKVRQNVDSDVIIRALMREVDYDKLGRSLWNAAEADFDLEHLMSSVINVTHLDAIHDELIVNGTVSEWLIKSIHPELEVATVNRLFYNLKNLTYKFVDIMTNSERMDDYLFNMIQQKALTPIGNIIQRVKDEKPETLDQLVEIILSNVNKVISVREMHFRAIDSTCLVDAARNNIRPRPRRLSRLRRRVNR